MRARGSVLIVVLFVLSILSIVLLSVAYRVGLQTRSVRHEAIRVKLNALSRSAAAVAIAELALDANEFDHGAEAWHSHRPLEEQNLLPEWSPILSGDNGQPAYRTRYRVIDEESKLHILRASSDALERIGLSKLQIDSVLDWMDGDTVMRSEGAEDDFYLSKSVPHVSKNQPIEVLEELLVVRGIDPVTFYGHGVRPGLIGEEGSANVGDLGSSFDGGTLPTVGLVGLLTSMGQGKININTAPVAVLELLPISEEAVSQVVGYRRFDSASSGTLLDHVFRSPDDIERLQGLIDAERDTLIGLVRFDSEHFRIMIESFHQSTGLSHRLEVLVHKKDGDIEVLRWK